MHKTSELNQTKLIINADDFGWNRNITDAIYEAFLKGLISDTTIMANGNDFVHAVDLVHSNNELSKRIGVHINLTQGNPLSERIKKCKRLVSNGNLTSFLILSKTKLSGINSEEKIAIVEEIDAQLQKVTNSGINISHVDSHQHVHTNPYVLSLMLNECKKVGITKIRLQKNIVDRGFIRNIYYKLFNKVIRDFGFISTDYFGNLFEYSKLKIGGGYYEMMVHPDYANGELINRVKTLNNEVQGELLENQILNYLKIRGVNLISYKDL